MEVEPRLRPRSRSMSMTQLRTPFFTRMRDWWSSLKLKARRSETSQRSSFDSTIGLIRTWSTGPRKRFFGFSSPCMSRDKSRRDRRRPPSLKPFILGEKPDVVPFQRDGSIDEDDHQYFLRSPLAFAYDIDYSLANAGGTGGGQGPRVRFMDEPETPKPQGAYTSPVFNDKENRLHRRTLSHATMNSPAVNTASGADSPISEALNVIPPSRARVRDLWLLSPQSSSSDHPSSIGYYSNYQNLTRSPRSHKRREYRFPSPPTATEEREGLFVIGDISDNESSTEGH